MYEYTGTVVNVVDGDTIDVMIDLGFGIHTKQRLRLARINAFETRLGRGTTEEQKQKGLEAKEFAIKILSQQVVKLTTKKKGKYGRFIAEIFFKDGKIEFNLSDVMVQKGFAKNASY